MEVEEEEKGKKEESEITEQKKMKGEKKKKGWIDNITKERIRFLLSSIWFIFTLSWRKKEKEKT